MKEEKIDISGIDPDLVSQEKPQIKHAKILNKKKIAISVSVNEDLEKIGFSEQHLNDISIEIARYIIANDGTALYGGDLRENGFTHYFSELSNQYKTEAMTLYVESLARELEIVTHEIDQIIKGFPSTDDNRIDDHALAAFMVYHNVRLRRFNLEVEESFYFLDEERVVGKSNQQIQETIAPTHTRSIGTLSVSQI